MQPALLRNTETLGTDGWIVLCVSTLTRHRENIARFSLLSSSVVVFSIRGFDIKQSDGSRSKPFLSSLVKNVI